MVVIYKGQEIRSVLFGEFVSPGCTCTKDKKIVLFYLASSCLLVPVQGQEIRSVGCTCTKVKQIGLFYLVSSCLLAVLLKRTRNSVCSIWRVPVSWLYLYKGQETRSVLFGEFLSLGCTFTKDKKLGLFFLTSSCLLAVLLQRIRNSVCSIWQVPAACLYLYKGQETRSVLFGEFLSLGCTFTKDKKIGLFFLASSCLLAVPLQRIRNSVCSFWRVPVFWLDLYKGQETRSVLLDKFLSLGCNCTKEKT